MRWLVFSARAERGRFGETAGEAFVFGLEAIWVPRRADERRVPDFAELDSGLLIPTC